MSGNMSKAAGSIDGLSDAYLVAVHVKGRVEVATFMAEARARIEAKLADGRSLTAWEEENQQRALATPRDETQPAVELAALVVGSRVDFTNSIVTAYAAMVLPGKGITEALADGPPYRVGRFARAHNGSYAPWSFIDSRSDEAGELLAYAREAI